MATFRTAIRCAAATVVLLVAVTAGTGSLVSGDRAGAQIVEDDSTEEAPGLGNIIGSPEAGPDPEDAGDRGGWAQLVLAVVLFGGIGFIAWRIASGLRTQQT